MNHILKKYCPRIEFDSYEDFFENFKIDVPEAFNFGAAGAVYGARDVEGSRQGELSLTYADAAALASGRAQLETALTARLGAPQSRNGRETVWQTDDADGNLTAVTLSQLDEKTLTLQ